MCITLHFAFLFHSCLTSSSEFQNLTMAFHAFNLQNGTENY